MRPLFQADADFNYKIIVGLRRREAAVDFQDAYQGGVIALPDHQVLATAAARERSGMCPFDVSLLALRRLGV